MDFIDDVYFVRTPGRSIPCIVAQITHLVDPVIGGAVDLDHIEAVTGHDFTAGITFIARRGRGALHAVERLGQYTCGGGLACPA